MDAVNVYQKPVTLKNILKFALPTIAMTMFMAFYTMVYGLFVSSLIGTQALSAINLTAPVIQLVTAISTMLARDFSRDGFCILCPDAPTGVHFCPPGQPCVRPCSGREPFLHHSTVFHWV